MQGHDRLFVYQNFGQLLAHLKYALDITGALPGLAMLKIVGHKNNAAHISNHCGTFTVKYDLVVRFLEDASISTADEAEGLNEQEWR